MFLLFWSEYKFFSSCRSTMWPLLARRLSYFPTSYVHVAETSSLIQFKDTDKMSVNTTLRYVLCRNNNSHHRRQQSNHMDTGPASSRQNFWHECMPTLNTHTRSMTVSQYSQAHIKDKEQFKSQKQSCQLSKPHDIMMHTYSCTHFSEINVHIISKLSKTCY